MSFDKSQLYGLESVVWDIAEKAHAGQTRKGSGKSYFDEHVVGVFKYIHDLIESSKNLSGDAYIIRSVALLHDVIEDCKGYTAERLIEELIAGGWSSEEARLVVSYVQELTFDRKYHKSKQDYISTIFHDGREISIIVKLADRLDNITGIHSLDCWDIVKRLNYIIDAERMIEMTYKRLGSDWFSTKYQRIVHDILVDLRTTILKEYRAMGKE